MPRPPLYNHTEAAAYLGVTPQKLSRMVQAGEIEPPTTIGDRNRTFGFGLKETTGWKRTVLDRYLAEQRGEPA